MLSKEQNEKESFVEAAAGLAAAPLCRFCGSELAHVFVDLGMSPLSNAYLRAAELNRMEPFYPLRVYVCSHCFLVQLEEFEHPDQIFSDYLYFSSYSDSWLQHAKTYSDMISDRLGLNHRNRVVELASNDGYLLQYFKAKGVPVLGIEPAANTAAVAVAKGIPTMIEFFGQEIASQLTAAGMQADLIVGNNVLAHVPTLNDFVQGIKILLKPQGVATLEFPHLMRLIQENQFDTIYHEHFSYFSFLTVQQVFAAHGLLLFDVDEIPTHGGSLRIYACHSEDTSQSVSERVKDLRMREEDAGLGSLESYLCFADKARATKNDLLSFLIGAKRGRKSIVGYGAPAKGNTLLNYCGIRSDYIDYTVDRSPYKQGHFLPGTHIAIHHPDKIRETRPDYVLILPWNIKDEVMDQMSHIREWGGQFVIPIPTVRIL